MVNLRINWTVSEAGEAQSRSHLAEQDLLGL